MDWLEDAFFWAVVLVALWLVLPDHVRVSMRSGFGPLVHALADVVRGVIRAILPRIEWVAYQVVTGRPPPPHETASVKHNDAGTLTLTSSDQGEGTSNHTVHSRFTNDHEHGSGAFTRPGTERTDQEARTPTFSDCELDRTEQDWRLIIDSLERRGFLVLSDDEQETARKLIYQHGRQLRFDGQAAKGRAIESATGASRGGSSEYRRASLLYDRLIGRPEPAIVAPSLVEKRERSVNS
jgi:hypothetical protein